MLLDAYGYCREQQSKALIWNASRFSKAGLVLNFMHKISLYVSHSLAKKKCYMHE